MRRRIIEALTYPRMMLLDNLDGEECPEQLYFNPAREWCQTCEQGIECHWLTSNEEFRVLVREPIESLSKSLQFCIDYVNAQCVDASHNVRRCPCESCRWIKSARRLESEYRHKRRSRRQPILASVASQSA